MDTEGILASGDLRRALVQSKSQCDATREGSNFVQDFSLPSADLQAYDCYVTSTFSVKVLSLPVCDWKNEWQESLVLDVTPVSVKDIDVKLVLISNEALTSTTVRH